MNLDMNRKNLDRIATQIKTKLKILLYFYNKIKFIFYVNIKMGEKYEVKTKRKQVLSEEERKKRSERMKAIQERLRKVKAEKEPVVVSASESESEEEDVVEDIPEPEVVKKQTKPTKKPVKQNVEELSEAPEPKPKKIRPVEVPKKKPNVRKKISVKYYGDVSDYEIMNDNKMLQGLHQEDYSYKAKSKEMQNNLKAEKIDDKYEKMRKQLFGE